jgi:hypothetical protein
MGCDENGILHDTPPLDLLFRNNNTSYLTIKQLLGRDCPRLLQYIGIYHLMIQGFYITLRLKRPLSNLIRHKTDGIFALPSIKAFDLNLTFPFIKIALNDTSMKGFPSVGPSQLDSNCAQCSICRSFIF